jgi:uncharacterized coiled-coil protein SlyX
MSERVEELEGRIAELEATVEGLTEELVDRTERINELERQLGVAGSTDRGTGLTDSVDPTPAETESDPAPESEATKDADVEDENREREEGSDDIIVA